MHDTRIVLMIASATLAFSTIAAPAQMERRVGIDFNATVVRVADGDTVEIVPAGEKRAIRVRLQGVDAPELSEKFGRPSQAFLRGLLLKQAVRVSGRDVDRYGRLVARITADGKDASAELLRAGMACHRFAPDATLASVESEARVAQVGFWAATDKPQCVALSAGAATRTLPTRTTTTRSAPAIVPPATADAATRYHGNVRSRVYHTPTCPNYHCRNCTRVFVTETEARAAGFSPAGDCSH